MSNIPRKLLVVEDEPFIAEDIGLILRRLGFDVVAVVDNGEAGTTDTFSLTLTPGGTTSGNLKRGNIQVHD